MKIYNYIKLFIFIVFSVLLFVFKDELVSNLNYFVASLILAFGLESVIMLSIVLKKGAFKTTKYAFSFFEIILGLTMMFAIKEFAYTCIIWAVWSILRQSLDIHEVLSRKVTGVVAFIYLVQSIASIVFSIILLINPSEKHALHHIYLLIAELLVISLPPVVSELLTVYRTRKNRN